MRDPAQRPASRPAEGPDTSLALCAPHRARPAACHAHVHVADVITGQPAPDHSHVAFAVEVSPNPGHAEMLFALALPWEGDVKLLMYEARGSVVVLR